MILHRNLFLEEVAWQKGGTMQINSHVKRHKKAFVWQSVLAGGVILVSLMMISFITPTNTILGVVGASSLASSIFIALALSKSSASHPTRMLGAYLLAIICGIVCFYMGNGLKHFFPTDSQDFVYPLMGACAVGLTMLFMILFNLQHPPAAGLALGLVIENWRFATLIIILIAMLMVVFIKYLLKDRLVSFD